MLNHFFGSANISGSPTAYSHQKSRITNEAKKLGETFQVRINHPTQSLLATNSCIHADQKAKVSVSLCGDLVSSKSEKALDDFISGKSTLTHDKFKDLLRVANGTFALAIVAQETWLATDFLGARPIYYTAQDGIFLYSTSYELVKRLAGSINHLDFQAASEELSFGYPMGNRTLAKDIKVLRGGNYIHCSDGNFEITQYENKTVELPAYTTLEESLEASALALKASIDERIQPEKSQIALLSGGLDSRVITAHLVESGQQVLAGNYSAPNTLERIYAECFAEETGISLQIKDLETHLNSTSIGDITAISLNSAQKDLPNGKLFSGDGGGELLGFIDIQESLLRSTAKFGVNAAIEHMILLRLSRYIAGDKFKTLIIDNCKKGLLEEFETIDIKCTSKKAFAAYINLDLSRHLHRYFSGLGEESHELLLPFYDRRVIHAAMRIHELGSEQIGHRFYYRLLSYLSPSITKTPWQSYPTSLACPVNTGMKTGLNQWEHSKKKSRNDARVLAIKVLKLTTTARWPIKMNKVSIIWICSLAILGIYKSSYIFKQVLMLDSYFSEYSFDMVDLNK